MPADSTESRTRSPKMTDHERRFVTAQRIGHLATADRDAMPHIVPVCFALSSDVLYITMDEKPKRQPTARLKRLRNGAVADVVENRGGVVSGLFNEP